jgi:hypothetical protein
MSEDMRKFLTLVEPRAEVFQLPIPVTESLIRARFDSKKDDDGLPRYRFPGDTKNRVMVWSQWVEFMRELLDEECTITYFAIETHFEIEFPPEPGAEADLPILSQLEKKVI